MALTQNCDLYGALGEAGVNRAIKDLMLQRPSLFNYATKDIATNDRLWCAAVPCTHDVKKFNNPLFTVVDPIPVLGATSPPVGLGFCAQVTEVEIDFFPGNLIAIPPSLDPPLAAQHLALQLKICGAIECPSASEVDRIPAGGQLSNQVRSTVLPEDSIQLTGKLNCFCLDVVATGHVDQRTIAGVPSILAETDSLDVASVEPAGLEQNLVCYIKTAVNVLLREQLTVAVETLMLSFSIFDVNVATLSFSPTPDPPVPNNPAIESNELKVFVTMTVSP